MILETLAVAIAGGIGAAARFLLDSLLRRRVSARYPVGTLVINLSGSLLLGLVAGLVAAGLPADPWQAVLGTGFLGGYTTFSTAAVETVRLVQERRPWPVVLASVGMLSGGVLLAAFGLLIGGSLR